MSFETVADMAEFWAGEMRRVVVAGTGVVLVNVDGTVHAYLDQCPHKRIPLSLGRLCGHELTCGAHQWQFDVTTGQGINPASARLVEIPVRVSGGAVQIDVAGVQPGRTHG
jgi:toluene monooxygenase system ferredoxin subunit